MLWGMGISDAIFHFEIKDGGCTGMQTFKLLITFDLGCLLLTYYWPSSFFM